ncbi:DEAD/DEAH box helicase [Desulfatitalea tepidiphila]|uniref:DEAD/DEAH box helicase n=1 Tax=Desulfatitalea tepidiphila TaxID=1185843 RepID=UPI0006B5C8AC|nr:DEAD/DEAH box helicase [Desulfatitalea tepidiphila]
MNIRITNQLHLTAVPEAIRAELVSRLQFLNPKWVENERMGRWNRGVPKTLQFFRRRGPNGLVVPRGLMRQLILLAREHDEPVDIDDRRRKVDEVAFDFKGALRPFQKLAVTRMLARDFGTLSAPTGSGKTIMALWMIARRRQTTLIVVHSNELAKQWIERIEMHLGIPPEHIGFIGGGKQRLGASVTVAMVQSLYKCAEHVAPAIGHLVVDECHRAPSRTFTEAVTAFDAHYMLGLSATPWRRDGLSKLIFCHLGDVHHEVKAGDLVAAGHLLDIDVVFRTTPFASYADPVSEYSKMLSELTQHDERNRLIVADVHRAVQVENRPGVSLVLSDRKHHCQVLKALLQHKYHIRVEALTGDLSTEQRDAVLQRLNAGDIQVLVATGQLIGEGFDCPRLSTLFLATPVRFSGRIIQYLGRVLRPSEGVERAKVYDYVDGQVAPLKAAALARQKIYSKMQRSGKIDWEIDAG